MYYVLDALMFGLCTTVIVVLGILAWDMAKYVFGGE